MKITTARIQNTLLITIALLSGPTAFSQPVRVDAASGLSASDNTHQGTLDPATGLPISTRGEFTPGDVLNVTHQTAAEVHQLIFNGKYDEALQRCLEFHEQFKSQGSLIPLLGDWNELGRRFPQAQKALLAIRDHDVSEFSDGRGYVDLFSEISAINGHLSQQEATYALFTTIRDRDSALAQQCYFYVESLLVAKGEYQWCFDHMGDSQGRFSLIRQGYEMEQSSQQRMAELHRQTTERLEEWNTRNGLTRTLPRTDLSVRMAKMAAGHFVSRVGELVEILVATGHKTGAEKIRGQAIAVLDDPHLRSIVNDAEERIAQKKNK